MAKRRKLEAPSAADLSRIEAELGGGPVAKPAPIAQIAGQAAGGLDPRDMADREAGARLMRAEEQGLLLREIPIGEIDADALVRDRVVIDEAELGELQSSILKTGLRLPIEVFAQEEGAPYGLLSGYRRLMAVRRLWEGTELPQFATIRAILREPEVMGGAFAAMVEENEVRAQLSHYERGRIAVIAAGQGAFANTEAAVDGLFPVASKAKRSKIRSFALIFEELGDLLQYPDLLREKDGLRVAAALRAGQEDVLRDHLERLRPQTAEAEREVLMAAVDAAEPAPADVVRRKGGRPRKAVARRGTGAVTLEAQRVGDDLVIEIRGAALDDGDVDGFLSRIERMLRDF